MFRKIKSNKRKATREEKKAHREFLKEQHEEPLRRRDLDKKGKELYDSLHKKKKN